jgi:flagellar FliL protein
MADTSTEAPESTGGSKKTIIIFAIVVLLAIGASVGGTLMFLGGSEPEAVEAQPDVARPQAAIYHNLRPAFIINYVTGSKPRFLQADLTVMVRDPSVVEALINHSPLVRSRIVNYLTDQDFFTLQTHEGKEALREGLRELLDAILQEQEQIAGVQSVLLTNFVMQ